MEKINIYIKTAYYYKSNIKIYMFLKEVSFMKANIYLKKNLLNQNEIQKLKQDFSEFEQEKKLNNWNIKSITSSEYKNFLEDVYKRLNIQNHPSLNNLIIAKQLTEVISFFGKYDQLSFQRINYFNEKIKYYQNLKKKDFDIDLRKTENRKTIEYNNNFFNNKNNNNINVNEYYSNNNDNNNKNNKNINNNIKNIIENFYNPNKNKNYIPELVNRRIRLPIKKTDPFYPKLKSMIEELIEDSTQELYYHKIDMAIKNLEAAAYYISKIID